MWTGERVMSAAQGPRVVGLGGGHGLAVTLAAARRYASDVTAVVSVADDGGSSGRLRRDLGIPAPGDVRRCLVALAADPEGPWARAFGARFERGELEGHALGNLVVAGLVDTCGSFIAAIKEAGRLLDARGRVLPATAEGVVLTAVVGERRLSGQKAIEESGGPVARVAVEPPAPAPPEVLEAIAAADQIVLGPGSLFTSVLAVVAVPEIGAAVAARTGQLVFVCNLRPSRETPGFDAAAHVDALARHGVVPDVVLADPGTMEIGALRGSKLVSADLGRPDGWNHDPVRLAAALEALV